MNRLSTLLLIAASLLGIHRIEGGLPHRHELPARFHTLLAGAILASYLFDLEIDRAQLRRDLRGGVPLDVRVGGENFGGVAKSLADDHGCVLVGCRLELYQEDSLPGETLDSFAFRIAARARAYTAETGYEICGNFQSYQDRYRIVFGTSNSEWGCNIDLVDNGAWKSTRYTMHTHTREGGQGFSKVDDRAKLQGYVVGTRSITRRIGNMTRTTASSL